MSTAQPNPESDQRSKVLLAILALLTLIGLGWWGATTFGADDKDAEQSPPSASAPAREPSANSEPDDPANSPGTPVDTAPAESGVTTVPSTPAPGNSTGVTESQAAPSAVAPGAASSFAPTSERKPSPGDQEAAGKVLDAVVPVWASYDTLHGQWTEDIDSLEGVTDQFKAQSLSEGISLWGGLSRLSASAKDATMVEKKELWNAGSHALWRVTVERRIVSNESNPFVDTTERVSWDFLVKQDDSDGMKVDGFKDPAKANESPKTFTLV